MKKRYILLLMLSIVLAFTVLFSAGAQEDDDNWFFGKPIKDLSFKGLEVIKLSDLRPLVQGYIGQEFTLELFWEIQGNLLALEYFEDIEANAKEGDAEKTSVIIEFTVTERPAVSAIKIVGNKRVSNSDILEVVGVKEGDFINEAQVKVDELSISDLYLEKGYRKVGVTSRLEADEEKNTVIIYFDVFEGYKTTIKDIEFSGNEFASANTLRGKLTQKKQGLFESGIFQDNLLEEDKQKIVDYYRSNGYLDAKVERVEKSIDDNEDKERSYITLIFYVTEGKQYTFGKMDVEGNVIFSVEEIKALVRQKTGEPINMVKMEQDFQKIKFLYSDSGYIFNIINLVPLRDEENRIVDYTITIIERDKAHIADIILEGNEKTKDYVIFRELPFESGDIFSTEKLRAGYFNLYNLQYFSNIVMNPIQSDVDGLMDLVINVEEQSWADFKFAMVFSGGEFPVSGQIGWADKNFQGTGRTLGVDLEFSNMKQGISANFSDNYLFGKGWGGGASFSIYHNRYQNALQDIIAPIFTDVDIPDPYSSVDEYDDSSTASLTMVYDSLDISTGVSTRYLIDTLLGNLILSTSLGISTSYVWYDDTKYRHYNKTIRDNLDRFVFINSWSNTIKLDDRDIYHNPENGYLLQQDIKFAGGLLLGSRHYTKLKTTAEGFLTLFKLPISEYWSWQTVLAIHGAMSFILPPVGGEIVASEQEKLYVDGMNTARGWNVIRNKESMLDFSLELRTPFLKDYLWGVLFADAAALWNDYSGVFTNEGGLANSPYMENFYFSIGAGIKLTMPGLPLRVYLAQPFKMRGGAWELGEGDFPVGPLDLKFVLAITQPGGF